MAVRMTLDNFVECEGNRAALKAVVALSDGRGCGLEPLAVIGPPGSGKTHLLQGATERIAAARGHEAYCMEAAPLVLGCSAAVASGERSNLDALRRVLAPAPGVILENMHRVDEEPLAPGTWEAVAGALSGTRLLAMSSRVPIEELESIDLRSCPWLKPPVSVTLEIPGPAALVEIISRCAHDVGARIPEDSGVAEEIVRHHYRGITDYKNALFKVVAYGVVNRERVNVRLVQRVLGPIDTSGPTPGC